jgi:hypothetical protein
MQSEIHNSLFTFISVYHPMLLLPIPDGKGRFSLRQLFLAQVSVTFFRDCSFYAPSWKTLLPEVHQMFLPRLLRALGLFTMLLGENVDSIQPKTLYGSLVAVSSHEKKEEKKQTKGRERSRRYVMCLTKHFLCTLQNIPTTMYCDCVLPYNGALLNMLIQLENDLTLVASQSVCGHPLIHSTTFRPHPRQTVRGHSWQRQRWLGLVIPSPWTADRRTRRRGRRRDVSASRQIRHSHQRWRD